MREQTYNQCLEKLEKLNLRVGSIIKHRDRVAKIIIKKASKDPYREDYRIRTLQKTKNNFWSDRVYGFNHNWVQSIIKY